MTHLNPEERKDYRCSFCHIMFDTVKIRERHEERHKVRSKICCFSEICPLTILRLLRFILPANVLNEQQILGLNKDGETFACETCDRTFKNEKNLNHHVKTHHVEKPKDSEKSS